MAKRSKKQTQTVSHVQRATIIGLVGVWLVVLAMWMDTTATDAAVSVSIFGLFGFIFGMVAFVWLLHSAIRK